MEVLINSLYTQDPFHTPSLSSLHTLTLITHPHTHTDTHTHPPTHTHTYTYRLRPGSQYDAEPMFPYVNLRLFSSVSHWNRLESYSSVNVVTKWRHIVNHA